MELDKADQIKYKKILIETMKDFIAFCKKHELRYYACSGSCLGAVRHKGFIPWDDDIDVLMPREDYNKFITLNDQLNNTGYEICSLGTPGYYLPFAKFINKKTTLFEYRDFPFVIGAFIDIFPLDKVSDISNAQILFEKQKLIFEKYRMTIRKYYVSDILKLMIRGHIRSFVKDSFYLIFGRMLTKRFLNRAISLEQEKQSQDGDKCICYCGFYKFKNELCERSWFGNGIELPFEDFTVVVPQNYEAYLTNLFGDYMTPPPVEKQDTHHTIYFIDLDKRWDLKDVMKLKLGKQIRKEYKYE